MKGDRAVNNRSITLSHIMLHHIFLRTKTNEDNPLPSSFVSPLLEDVVLMASESNLGPSECHLHEMERK